MHALELCVIECALIDGYFKQKQNVITITSGECRQVKKKKPCYTRANERRDRLALQIEGEALGLDNKKKKLRYEYLLVQLRTLELMYIGVTRNYL